MAQPNSSRLQKLLNLLESGSSESIRKAAASQIAEVARAYPEQLPSISRKVHGLLYSKSWETRVAAGTALGHLAEAVPHHTPTDLAERAVQCGAAASTAQALKPPPQLPFDGAGNPVSGSTGGVLSSFNLKLVLERGTVLVASGGQEYDLGEDASLTAKQRLDKQRGRLKKRLGLDGTMEQFMSADDLIQDEDLADAPATAAGSALGGAAEEGRQQASDLLQSLVPLSARERNKLKRQAKAMARSDSSKMLPLPLNTPAGGGAAAHAAMAAHASRQANDEAAAETDAEEWKRVEGGGWPFQLIMERLMLDVLDPVWEVRHGAAVALRDILRSHAACAGVEAPLAEGLTGWAAGGTGKRQLLQAVSCEQAAGAAEANRGVLEDVVVSLLCVLALDRFGDYVSDQVTAPVRETAAQALGLALQSADTAGVMSVVELLQQLRQQSSWEVRHGGLLGLKYLLASRADLAALLLPHALPALLSGLRDADDDVRAASADALVPVAPALQDSGAQAMSSVTVLLWDLLTQLEELSPATSSVMSLLAIVYSQPAASQLDAGLGQLVTRLWPYFRHPLATVRTSTMLCLERLLVASVAQQRSAWVEAAAAPLAGLLRLVFQNLLMEGDTRVLRASLSIWHLLLQCCGAHALAQAIPPPLLASFISLASTSAAHPLDPTLIVVAPSSGGDLRPAGGASASSAAASHAAPTAPANKRARLASSAAITPVGGGDAGPERPFEFVVGSLGEGSAVRMRMLAAKALGALCCKVHGSDGGAAASLVLSTLYNSAASSRALGSLTLMHWHQHYKAASAAASVSAAAIAGQGAVAPLPAPAQLPAIGAAGALPPPVELTQAVHSLLSASLPSQPSLPHSAEPYAEAAPLYLSMRREMMALIAASLEAGWLLHTPDGLLVEQLRIEHVVAMLNNMPQAEEAEAVSSARLRVAGLVSHLQLLEQYLHMTTLACGAAAAVETGALPVKLNQLIQPLMNAVRKEPEAQIQEVCASALAELMSLVAVRTPCPNDKLSRNIATMACGDAEDTPSAAAADSAAAAAAALEDRLASHQAAGPRSSGAASHRASALVSSTSLGGAGAARSSVAAPTAAAADEPAAQAARIARRGAEAVLRAVAARFGAGLWTALPALWELLGASLMLLGGPTLAGGVSHPSAAVDPQSVVNALQLLRVVGPHVVPELFGTVEGLMPALVACSRHSNGAVRSMAARCLSTLCEFWLDRVMPLLLRLLLPALSSDASDACRLGAVELVAAVVARLGGRLVAYAVLLVVPLLKRMSDASAAVRGHATSCFGSLCALLPLAQTTALPPGLDPEQAATVQQDSAFLLQLLDNKRADDYVMPIKLSVELRAYQQEGINWLAFLRTFGLHGVLADDMGLGKTLQATAIVAAAAAEEGRRWRDAGRPSAARPPPSLVVCPATLVAHWAHEVAKFVDPSALRVMQYDGNGLQRCALQPLLLGTGAGDQHDDGLPFNILVTSYETLRSDIDWLGAQQWLYCILDEGHVIKSPKAGITLACKAVNARHRLILSGTPIQNDVVELWSLFDFLMPGFLGPERDFNAKFGKAVQVAKTKKSLKESEAGVLAVDALHKQVMPFVLRRSKAQVLADLPPKIIQDVYCTMSPLQARLYEDFQQSQASAEVVNALKSSAGGTSAVTEGSNTQVFTALSYLRKLCSHPLLVMDWRVEEHRQAALEVLQVDSWVRAEGALHEVRHAPKLVALRDLLNQCGIISAAALGGGEGDYGEGDADGGGAAGGGGGGSGGHRVLVFAQQKGMLDLVERDVLQACGVTYLRLDGSVEPAARFALVQRFNADPTIDVLLLTTSVGGLGLNLTSADTVVFLEHDWNPQKDLQAMDRAHRLGQTRTVNVYRLLIKDSLEEKVMGLQQFKLDVASAGATTENVSMATMDTTQLLDLFGTGDGTAAAPGAAGASAGDAAAAAASSAAAGASDAAAGKTGGAAAMMAGLGELWDESQYESEFSLDSFLGKMSKPK